MLVEVGTSYVSSKPKKKPAFPARNPTRRIIFGSENTSARMGGKIGLLWNNVPTVTKIVVSMKTNKLMTKYAMAHRKFAWWTEMARITVSVQSRRKRTTTAAMFEV
jgi:hypothetical protein